MTAFDRADRSVVGRWWWTIDRWTLAVLVALLAAGVVLVMAASPPVAERIDTDAFHFVRRHFLFMVPAVATMFAVSLLDPRGVRWLAVLILLVSIVLLAVTLLVSPEMNGARRWIALGPVSIQASEFVKPALAVTAAWLFASAKRNPGFPGYGLSAGLVTLVVALLVLQPDFGMTATVLAIWGGQLFLAGLSLVLVGGLVVLAAGGLGAGYLLFEYVRRRINGFIDPGSTDSFQVDMSMNAFVSGGLTGRGPGEGVVKHNLPDAHSDFIFAVAGEEFGLLACLLLMAMFAFIALRGFVRMTSERDLFILLAVAGLLIQFTVQAIVNMGVSLQLLPATGMTLPFVSYGGSSLLGIAIGMGMMLALTRHRPEHGRVS